MRRRWCAIGGIVLVSCVQPRPEHERARPSPSDASVDAAVDPPPPPDASAPDASHPAIDAGPPPPIEDPYDAVLLSPADRSTAVRIDASGVGAEWRTLGMAGIRSDRAIAPGEGVFYFEATIPTSFDAFTIGVATAEAPLTERAGQNLASFGLDTGGHLYAYGGALAGSFPRTNLTFGFVVDYRAPTPVVHVLLDDGGARVRQSEALTGIAEPLYVFLSGSRRTIGTHVSINFGNDTVNFPFRYDAASLLRDAGLDDAADALVPGFGGTHAGIWNEPPTITPPEAPRPVPVGTEVRLAASAEDPEDGRLAASIVWEVLSTGYGPEQVRGTGATFRFTPAAIGTHPVRVSVVDAGGKSASAVVTVTATGTLPRFADVRMTPEPTSGRGIVVSADGLRARWTENDKYAIRANQGLYGAFWYFEGRRLVAPENEGFGLVIGGASLDPYVFNDTPPSCSVNALGGVYLDLIFQTPIPRSADTYGFAVDYRGLYPIVHVIVDGAVLTTLHLRDATVPVYPMLYGNPTLAAAEWDSEINFGGAPFAYDPARALAAAGIDASGLLVCWGDANAACP